MKGQKTPRISYTVRNDTHLITTRSQGLRYSVRTSKSLNTGFSSTSIVRNDLSANTFFKVVFGVIFAFMFVQLVAGNGEGLSFRGFLEVLQNAPTIPLDWLWKVKDALTLNSGIQSLDGFVNMLSSLLVGTIYISVGVAQVFSYAVYFISILFGMRY